MERAAPGILTPHLAIGTVIHVAALATNNNIHIRNVCLYYIYLRAQSKVLSGNESIRQALVKGGAEYLAKVRVQGRVRADMSVEDMLRGSTRTRSTNVAFAWLSHPQPCLG